MSSMSQSSKSNLVPMGIIGLLFFIFGFVTWLNGSLIPFLKVVCELTEFQALFVTFAFYIAYTVMALPMSLILQRTGYKNGMALGLGIMVIGALLHIPAAMSANFLFFLAALFVLATGLTILQTASNPYIVYLGPIESAAMRISIMGIINKSAGVIVPIVFTSVILSGIGDISDSHLASLPDAERVAVLNDLSASLSMPYLVMAGALLVLIGLVKFSNLPEIDSDDDNQPSEQKHQSILSAPQTVLGALAIFAYVGVEVIAGDTIGLFGSTLNMANVTELTSYTMVFMVLGYTIGVLCIPKYISQQVALYSSGIAGVLCSIGVVFSSTESTWIADILWGWSGFAVLPNALTFVALMGLAHALVFPCIWPLALDGLNKKLSAQGSALLIMGISGGAIMPLLFGQISHVTGDIQLGYWVAVPCYLFIFYYAVSGHKKRQW